ncbi:MFS transporter [Massilia dura]|uniref:MFS transporter n=1 Tax=Pseudoduganella dura TaxID=321982 RepID=A0A6I3X9E8_9BURK|nr:multidrug effflux MFS transporter [Pseudoduganella dura]MUI11230.1 MFS transporter [Pseudoduganella dura]
MTMPQAPLPVDRHPAGPGSPGPQPAVPQAVLLTLLLAAQPVATDLYLPALPHIASGLGAAAGHVQATLTVFILAFGVAQLAAGPLVDHHGRRRVLLWGLALYVLSAGAGALAGSLPQLLAARAVQGIATAASVIAARAIIRDRHAGPAGMRIMARSLTGQSAIGVACPLAGGLAAQYLGWQATLGMVAGFGVLAWVAVYAGYRETWTRPTATSRAGWRTFLSNPQFVACALLAGLSFSGALCFLILSPFVFIGEFGMSRLAYGALPALCSLAFLLGTVLCGRLLRHWSVPRVVRLGACLSLLGGAGQVLLWHGGVHTVWALAVPQCVYMLGHGFHNPCGQAGAVAPFPAQAGRAAALSGFVLTATGFVSGQLATASGASASDTLVGAMGCITALLAAVALVFVPFAYRGGPVLRSAGN